MQNGIGVMIFVISAIGLIFLSIRWSKSETLRYGYYVVILCFYIMAGLVTYLTFGPFDFFPDAEYYHLGGIAILDFWQGSGPSPYGDLWQSLMGKMAWPTVTAAIYWLVGVQPAAVIFLNIGLLSATAVVVAATVRKIQANFVPGRLFTVTYLLVPFIPVFGISMGREAVYWLATAVMVYATAEFLSERWLKAAATFMVASIVLVLFRPNLGIPQIYAFVIPLSIVWAVKSYPFNARKFMQVVGVALVIGASLLPAKTLITEGSYSVAFTRTALSEGANSGFSPENDVPEADDATEPNSNSLATPEPNTSAEADSGASPSGGKSWIDFAGSSFRTLPRGMFGPFPTEFDLKPVMILSEINLMYWLAVLGMTTFGVIKNWKRTHGLVYLAVSFLVIAVISSLLTNYGILIRFRAVAVLVLLPYALYVLTRLFESNKERKLEK